MEDFEIKVVEAINTKLGTSLQYVDWQAWYEGEGNGDSEAMDNAVKTIVGEESYDNAENEARLDNLLFYKLGLGDRVVGGIDLEQL